MLLSIAVRVAYFAELSGGPLMHEHEFQESDMAFFDRWARDIAAGDLLTDKALHPQHQWHKEVAEVYFTEHPTATAELSRQAGRPLSLDEASAMLWERWYGGKSFHQEPLYPYLLAITYKLFGPDVRWAYIWQMIGGVLANVLIYLLARRYFGNLVGAVAGIMAVLCSPMLYYELMLLRESLILMMGLLLACLTAVAIDRKRWHRWLFAGVVFGVAQMLKATFALILLPVLAVILITAVSTAWRTAKAQPAPAQQPSRGLAKPDAWRGLLPLMLGGAMSSAGVVVAGFLIGMSPMMARNVAVGLQPLGPSSVGAITYIGANTTDYQPETGFHISRTRAAQIMGKTNGKFLDAVFMTLGDHTLGSFLALTWRKFRASWYWYEVPCNSNFYYYRMHANILWMPMTFTMLGPLSLVGLLVAFPTIRWSWPLYVLVLSTLATMLIFYPSSQFRAPMTAGCIPFAALTLVRVIERFSTRKSFLALPLALAVSGLAFWIDRPLPQGMDELRPVDCIVPYDHFYDRAVDDALKAGDKNKAADILLNSLRFEPDSCRVIGPGRPIQDDNEAAMASIYGPVHYRAAQLLEAAGRHQEARQQQDAAMRLAQALRSLGQQGQSR